MLFCFILTSNPQTIRWNIESENNLIGHSRKGRNDIRINNEMHNSQPQTDNFFYYNTFLPKMIN